MKQETEWCSWSGATYWSLKEMKNGFLTVLEGDQEVKCLCGKVVKIRKHPFNSMYLMVSRHKEPQKP